MLKRTDSDQGSETFQEGALAGAGQGAAIWPDGSQNLAGNSQGNQPILEETEAQEDGGGVPRSTPQKLPKTFSGKQEREASSQRRKDAYLCLLFLENDLIKELKGRERGRVGGEEERKKGWRETGRERRQ